MRITAKTIAVAFVLSTTIAAAEEKTPASGMPFCLNMDDLQEFMIASLKKDKAWLSQLENCALIKGGVRIGVIEEYPETKMGHVSKIRILAEPSGVVGYGYFLPSGK